MPTSGTTVSLSGWDAVNALSYAALNEAMAAAPSAIPTNFDFTDDTGIRISGTWTGWRIVQSSSSGAFLAMELQFGQGSQIKRGPQELDLTGGWIRIQIRLAFLTQHAEPSSDPTAEGGTVLVLQPNPEGMGDEPPVEVLATSFDQSHIIWRNDLKGTFGDYFSQNLGQFTQAFHVAILESAATDGKFQWLKPVEVSYAVAEPTNPDDFDPDSAVFGVLMLFEGSDPENTTQVVDHSILGHAPAGCNAAFVLSQEQLTKQMLLPAAAQILDGSQLQDFEIVSDGLTVQNLKDLKWQDIKLEDGKVVSPLLKAGDFKVRVEADRILLEFFHMSFDAPDYHMPGHIIVDMTWTQEFFLKAGQTEDGGLRLTPTDVDPTDPDPAHGKINLQDPIVCVYPDDKARTFQKVMLGLTIAASVLGVVAAGTKFVGFLARWASSGTELAEGASEVAMAGEVIAANGNVYESATSALQITQAATGLARVGEVTAAWGPALNKVMLASALSTLVTGIIYANPEWVKAALEDDLDHPEGIPAMDAFASNLLGASQWPGNGAWKIKDARLAGALVVYGTVEA